MKRHPEWFLLIFILAYCIGVIAVVFASRLPSVEYCVSALLISGAGWFFRRNYFCLFLFIFVIGFSWATYCANELLKKQLPKSWINQKIVVEGRIDNLPLQINSFYIKFPLQLSSHQHLLLNWYGHYPLLKVGQFWRLTVKVKPPHGLQNPNSFDYQRALFFEDKQGTGYVINHARNELLSESNWHYPIHHVREKIENTIMESVKNKEWAAFLDALTTGSRSLMSGAQWTVFENTGSSYLIVISGLHIAVIGAAVYFFLSRLLRRINFLLVAEWVQSIASGSALLAAWFYGLLAGWTLPTQRAMIMLTVFMLGPLLNREISLTQRWLFAFALIIIFEPFALLNAGFWLSFVAVAWIGFLISGREQKKSLWRWFWLQCAIFLGLVPLTILYFHQISGVTVLASLLGLPWVEFLMVPLCVLAAAIDLFFHAGAKILFLGLGYLLWPIWWYLEKLSQISSMIWPINWNTIWVGWAAQIGIFLGFAPINFSLRCVGLLWLLPLFYPMMKSPQAGELSLMVLDVGQGLASVVETAHHRLVYDTGPRYDGFDSGERVLLPYLAQRHIKRLDLLVVSHGDNDHSGGAETLLSHLPTKAVLTSVPERFAAGKACFAGQHWKWDGVQFSILSPPLGEAYQHNNSSCVLKITSDKFSVLLTGDIEKKREKWLLSNSKEALSATVLVAPHHGSKSSSFVAFVSAVHPSYVLFPVGYYNRYKFPAEAVVARYTAIKAIPFTTAAAGAIQVHLTKGKITVEATHQRRYFWQTS